MERDVGRRVAGAAKWSIAAETAAKLATMGVNMVLARLVAPEAYGVLTTALMVTSFADLFTDAGFQKYLIQHEFLGSDDRLDDAANVAFWSNLGFSLLLWLAVTLLRNPIAALAGSPGYGLVVAVACAQLPVTALTSIQLALLRRSLDFRRLFFVRMAQCLTPLLVTVPLALIGLSHWALVAGTIASHLVTAVVLLFSARWRPRWFYRLAVLKSMLSFSVWTLLESVTIWLCSWFDLFVIGSAFSGYALGLYKNAINSANGLLALITAAIPTVLFSGLSRLQNDDAAFHRLYLSVQRAMAFLVFPMGTGLLLYSDLATGVLLGSGWAEAAPIVGLWAFSTALMAIGSWPGSEVFRAKGQPRLSLLAQAISLALSVPICLSAVPHGFDAVVRAAVVSRFTLLIAVWVLLRVRFSFSIRDMLTNLWKPALCTVLMAGFALLLRQLGSGALWDWLSIGLCALLYALLLLLIAREDVKLAFQLLLRRRDAA